MKKKNIRNFRLPGAVLIILILFICGCTQKEPPASQEQSIIEDTKIDATWVLKAQEFENKFSMSGSIKNVVDHATEYSWEYKFGNAIKKVTATYTDKYMFNKSGLISEKVLHSIGDGIYRELFEYDANNRLLVHKEFTAGKLNKLEKYDYSSDETIYSVKEYFGNGTEFSTTYYDYTNNYELVLTCVTADKDNQYKSKKTFNADGYLVSYVDLDNRFYNKYPVFVRKYEKNNRISEEAEKYWGTGLRMGNRYDTDKCSDIRYEYVLDEKGNWIVQKRFETVTFPEEDNKEKLTRVIERKIVYN